MKLWNAKTKVEHMFIEQPWFIGADIEVNGKTNEYFVLVGIDRVHPDAPRLLETMARVKIDRIPLKPVLKDR